MNEFDDVPIDTTSSAWRELTGEPQWTPWVITSSTFGSIVETGSPIYTARYKRVGGECRFQVKLDPNGGTIAATAGTHYLTLPITAKGLAGEAIMSNATTKIVVDDCHVDATNSRCYLPTQGASVNLFTIAGWYEI